MLNRLPFLNCVWKNVVICRVVSPDEYVLHVVGFSNTQKT